MGLLCATWDGKPIRNNSHVTAGPQTTLGYLRRLLHPGDRELGNSELGGLVLHRYSAKTDSVLGAVVWVEGSQFVKSTDLTSEPADAH